LVAPGLVSPQESPYEPTNKFCEKIKEALKAGKSQKTAQAGSAPVQFSDVPPNGRVLVGFDVAIGEFAHSKPIISALRPLYRNQVGLMQGPTFGVVKPGVPLVRVLARKGYAVAALTAKTGLGLDGFKLKFMALTQGGLDAAHSYESDWVGGNPSSAKEKILAGDGALVVGVFGEMSTGGLSPRVGLGLVTIPKE
jgi:hypothetical protein